MRNLFLLIFILLLPFSILGQENENLYLSFEEYLSLVKAGHPVVRQANLRVEEAQAGLLKARGSFDPKLESNYDRKMFKETEYYDILNAGFKIPTWFGIELKGKYENNSGVYLNPQNNVPDEGLFAAGISVPVGQGLFINERMAALKQAKVFRQQSEAERELLINEILYQASLAYFDWLTAYQKLELYQNFSANAEIRTQGIKRSYEAGDKPAIDTLEAGITLQNRLLDLEQARLDYLKSSLNVSTYLWTEDYVPLEVEENLYPTITTIEETDEIIGLIPNELDEHPKIQSLNFKIEALEYERRLKANKLLPKLDLEYNFLSDDFEEINSLNYDDYKFGLSFSMPLFLRKERGDLKLSKIKIENAGLDLNNKRLELRTKISALRQQLNSLKSQNELINDIVEDYEAMLAGELRKLELGESSIFLVNTRENSLISAREKQIDLQNKLLDSRVELLKVLARLQEI